MQSFEPGESWFWDYRDERMLSGPELAAPHQRPIEQGAPAPAHLVPADWESRLH